MGNARRLYERFSQFLHESAKFGIIGIVGVLLYNLVDNSLVFIGPLKAATVAVVVTTVASYVANRHWSFRHRKRSTVPREAVMFFALNVVGLLIQWAAVGVTYYGLGETGKLANFIANNVGIVLGTLFRFWSYRRWVWAAPRQTPAEHTTLAPALAAGARHYTSADDEARRPL